MYDDALPPDDRYPLRKPNRAQPDDDPGRKGGSLPPSWKRFETGDIGRRIYGRQAPSRSQQQRQRRKGR